jgi:tetratricopeptide (TPR) repeat protein
VTGRDLNQRHAGETTRALYSMAAVGLILWFRHTGDLRPLNWAIKILGRLVDRVPHDEMDRALILAALGDALYFRFGRTGNRSDLSAAIDGAREAARMLPEGHSDRPVCLDTLGNLLRTRFMLGGDPADVNEGIDAARGAVGAGPAVASFKNNLGSILMVRYKRTGDPADIDDAIRFCNEAVATMSPMYRNRGQYLSNLGTALDTRYEKTGSLQDLDQALAAHRQAVEATRENDFERRLRLNNLGNVWFFRFERTGRLADLDNAVQTKLDAVAASSPDHFEHGLFLSGLAMTLHTRFDRTGNRSDLEEALRAGREAVAATAADDFNRVIYLSTLGSILQTRYGVTEDLDDLDSAIQIKSDAVAATPVDYADRGIYLSNLGNALRLRYRRCGELNDLDRALGLGRAAIGTTTDNDPRRAIYLSSLAATLQVRFDHTKDAADLDEAIQTYRTALAAMPADHPNHAEYLSDLGLALWERYDQLEQTDDVDEAKQLLRRAAESRESHPSKRLFAAKCWGELAAAVQDADGAVAGFVTAVKLLPLAAWRGLDRRAREQYLAEYAGLASSAAAWAIELGLPDLAVETLEMGRSLLWTQALQTRGDLTVLHETDPRLATRMEEVRAALNAHETADFGRKVLSRGGPEEAARRHRRLTEEWEALVEQARTVLGDATFLGPPSIEQLRLAAADGAVIVLNVSSYRCDALIITAENVEHCPLPELSQSAVVERADAWLTAQSLAAENPGDPIARVHFTQTLRSLLRWLWDTAVGPVIDVLAGGRHADEPAPPRVWWCPTGPLALLPIHAAGHTQADWDGRSALDRVISSYAPTLRTLMRARRRPGPAERPKLLAVGMPITPDLPGQPRLSPLPQVPVELDRIHEQVPLDTRMQSSAHAHDVTTMSQSRTLPTRARVLKALDKHSWAHLACHGGQNLANPAEGAIYLVDGPLTVWQIAARDLRVADLAFLSACHTAIGGRTLPDESIHLAAALQLAGYRHVIAALWTIADNQAPAIADSIYQQLIDNGVPDPTRAADALHHAVVALQRSEPLHPEIWSPWVHIGP